MKKGLSLILILLIVVVLAAGLAFPRMRFYLIRASGGGGDLLWKNDEAYLFMIDRPIGYHLTGAELLAEPANEYFYAPAMPDNDGYALTIIHVTPSGIDQHVQKATVGIASFTPIGNSIYAICPGGLCRWNGHRFELITSEEEQKIGGRDHLVDDRKDLTDANGWSRRLIRAVGPAETPMHGQYSVEPCKQFTLLVTEGNPTSVVLQRPNMANETLWYYKQGLSVVRKAKYNRVFGPS